MANAKICSTLLIKYARNVIIHSQTEENISSNQAAVPECPNRRRIQRTQRGMGGGCVRVQRQPGTANRIKGGKKMIVYKIDVIESLKEAGYNSTRILKENIIGQSAMTKIRNGEPVGIKTLDKICELLDMQPGNIIKYVETKK